MIRSYKRTHNKCTIIYTIIYSTFVMCQFVTSYHQSQQMKCLSLKIFKWFMSLQSAFIHPFPNVRGKLKTQPQVWRYILCDSQEDDLAVDVCSDGEGRGEGFLAKQAFALVQGCLLDILIQLLLPSGESLDVNELRASTQRIHPITHRRWIYKQAHCKQMRQREERGR